MLSRVSRSLAGRSQLLLSSLQKQQLPILSNQFTSLDHENQNKFGGHQVSLFHQSALNSSLLHRFGFTSSASPEPNEKEQGSNAETNGAEPEKTTEDTISEETKESGSNSDSQHVKSRRGTKRTAFSESESEGEEDMSIEDLKKLLEEKEEILKSKNEEMEKMQDKVLRSLAEMENVMARTKREAENSKKFAIQNFAKGLLDVADNLGRASSVVKENFSKVDVSNDTSGAVPILKTLLEGVEMTEKQLGEVFRKFGIEKFDPMNEPLDPHRHNAVFQVPDPSKPPGTVAHVLKAGYTLHERVIRPAEVGVTQKNDEEENNQ